MDMIRTAVLAAVLLATLTACEAAHLAALIADEQMDAAERARRAECLARSGPPSECWAGQ